MNFSQYTIKNIQETFEALKTGQNGISDQEAESRLKTYGFNELKAKENGLFDIFLRQFKSPFFYLLFIAGLIALAVGEKVDALVLFVFIFINVSFGFFQEAKAQKAISLLQKFIPSKVRVRRDGMEKVIDKKYLVPGDIVLLETGSIVPADLRVLETDDFLVDESVLSGESIHLGKILNPLSTETKEVFEAKNIIFAGTSVSSGEAEGIVVGTGKQTAFGEITKLVSGITRESVFEKDILKFYKIILRTVITAVLFIFLANLMIKGTKNIFDFLIFSIALIVSIIPEALPLIITFSFSSGALRLAKEKVVVKRLSAVEDLGNIEILCTDKTGTLTKNKLELEEIFAQDQEKLFLYGLLASHYIEDGAQNSLNAFDLSLYEKSSPSVRLNLKNFKKVSFIPFESERLRNTMVVEDTEGKRFLIVRGAPEVILDLSSEFEYGKEKKEIQKEIEDHGREGKRILAISFKELKGEYSEKSEENMTFLGYFCFIDPLKETAKEAIQTAKKLGIQIKMITGDSKEVAGHIAHKVGLVRDVSEVISGKTLDSLPEKEFDEACLKFFIFARISPETKLKIIKSLQKKFEVGFLGEGLNDTPALKIADVGIVVQEAADVPRGAADVILLEKDLRVLIDGIKNGRKIFSNINKYIKCAMASNFGNFYSIAVISLFITFLPMLPIQILLGNLLSDFPLIAIASDTVDTEELKKPKTSRLSNFIGLIIILALVSTAFDFIFFGIFHGIKPAFMQTLWFIESILTELALLFIIRTRHFFLKTKKPSLTLSLLVLLDAIFIVALPFTGLGQKFFHFAAPPINYVLIVFGLVIAYFISSEIVKLLYYRRQKLNNHTLKVI
ncbi:MAG: HAD-IC family P-type ATPase [Patescibacteria group bacterium]|nr:HAD-IC family P-type ATPase [Patescibacteria group bacterium]